jgi:hypothetical protein
VAPVRFCVFHVLALLIYSHAKFSEAFLLVSVLVVLFLLFRLCVSIPPLRIPGAGNLMTQFAGNSLPTGIIVIGVFMMLVSLFGCVGAHRESRLLLGIYAVIVSILVICQIATGIAIYAKQSEIPVMLTVAWDVSNNWQKVTLVQDVLLCCGLNVFNATGGLSGSSGIAGIPCPEITRTTHQTCLLPMKAMIESSFSTVGVVALCFAFLQIIGFGFAVCLIRGIRLARDQDQHADQPAETTPSAV